MLKKSLFYFAMLFMCAFICIGYAANTDRLHISGDVDVHYPDYDVYINNLTAETSGGVTVSATPGTTAFMKVNGGGTAKFTVNFINVSDTSYVYERVIEGIETGFEGVYGGTDITYKVSGISVLDEIKPNGGTLKLDLEITAPSGASANLYILKFNFIEKTGTGILPGEHEVTVTFKYNNGSPDTTLKLHEDEFVPRPETPTLLGYTFMGWYLDKDFTTAWNFEADMVTKDITLYAKWEEIPTEYKVTFIPGKGLAEYIVFASQGSLLSVPATPESDGFVFTGWYTDLALTNAWNFDTDRVNSDMTLYGAWEVYVDPTPPYLDITFKPNNGDADTVITVLTGDFIPRPSTPVMDGYRFAGWYTDEGLTDAWNFEAERPEWHMTLYGAWEKIIKYTVTVKLNNGEADLTLTTLKGELVPPISIPQKSGYNFIGWYTDEECTAVWNMDVDRPNADMTLYAGWKKIESGAGGEYHGEFLGLVEALLSKTDNCLNDSNTIFNAVMNSLNNNKRPDEDPPIVHCQVRSVPGGNMATIASEANSLLGKNNDYYFVFEAEPDPALKNNRLYLYMYYGSECSAEKVGTRIVVYKQILTRGSDGVWYADGTYKGHAAVANIYGGGNNGQDVKTVNPYTWQLGELPQS